MVHLHLNPARHYPRVFIEAAGRLTDARLWLLAAGAFAYSLLRFAEAYGLWRERAWAEWIGIVSGGVYLPVEVYELVHRPTVLKAALLIVNAVIWPICVLSDSVIPMVHRDDLDNPRGLAIIGA